MRLGTGHGAAPRKSQQMDQLGHKVTNLRHRIYSLLPKPRALAAKGHVAKPVERVLVLCEGPNPTFSYYLEERLKALSIPFDVHFSDKGLGRVVADGLFVVIVRYIRPGPLFWLIRHRNRLSGIALLVDDDIAATCVAPDVDPLYRLHVARLGLLPLPFLNRVLTNLWTSTPALRTSIGAGTVVPPFPPLPTDDRSDKLRALSLRPEEGKIDCVMAFHATGAHNAEHRFLMPIVQQALEKHDNVRFEVIAESSMRRVWRNLLAPFGSRGIVIDTLDWSEYILNCVIKPRDILLVPLMQSSVNSVRADTKRVDVVRMGAAAIFSASSVYERYFTVGEIAVDHRPEFWLDAIDKLVGNDMRRDEARRATRDSLKRMRQEADVSLPGLEVYFKLGVLA